MATFVTNHLKPYETLTSRLSSQPLKGKSVFITGASRGVGEHITHAIAAAGAAKIGILGRDEKRVQNAKEKFTKEYPATEFLGYSANIVDETAITGVFKDFGAPDVLVNNAGVFPDDGPFISQDLKRWWSGFETNILGTAVVTQKYLQAKGPTTPGIVLNCSTMAAHMRWPLHGWSGYNSSKLGAARIFETLRFEHPEVRFISIHPGKVESDGYTRSGAAEPPEGMTDGALAGQFFAWAATDEAEFLRDRFVWAEWDIAELEAKKDEIIEKDLLLITIDGFNRGF
jgi:NAD(P)-dependent dehydrogenase (short-subunit alcohol dehydrogenase family)